MAGAVAADTIRLGVLLTTPSRWLEVFLREHRAGGAAERLEISEGRERDLQERLSRGRIDVALTIVRDDAERSPHDVLFTEGYRLAMSNQHVLAGRNKIAAEELAGEKMIVRRHCELLAQTSQHFTARGVRPFFSARTTSENRALCYVSCGLGVTVMPDCFEEAGVVRPCLADFPYTRTIGLIYAPHVDAGRMREGRVVRTLLRSIQQDRSLLGNRVSQ